MKTYGAFSNRRRRVTDSFDEEGLAVDQNLRAVRHYLGHDERDVVLLGVVLALKDLKGVCACTSVTTCLVV